MSEKHLKRKLQSQRGASITFALLLFLVCAVVGSVVLAAGSAAAGRMAGLPRSDQRYYSVSSAARLFEDKFGEQKITIERTYSYTRTEKTLVTRNADGSYQYGAKDILDPKNESYTYRLLDDKGNVQLSPQNLFQKLTCELVLGAAELAETTTDDAGWNDPVARSEKKTIYLTVGDKEELAVDIDILPDKTTHDDASNGAQLVMEFKNHADSTADTKTPQFKLRMTWIADADKPPVTTDETGKLKEIASVEETNKITSYSENAMNNENAMIVTSDVKETKTTSVTWHVVSLEVMGGGTGS